MKKIKPVEGNRTFCMAPWTHTYLSPQMERRLCCSSREESTNFKQYIDIGFREDYQLELYYDKSAKVSGMDAMIDNTYDKIKDF
jgi:hypothetical protein